MEVGIVRSVKNFLLDLDGLPSVKVNDIVKSESGTLGFVSSLLNDYIEVLLLDTKDVRPQEQFTTTLDTLAVPAGDFLLGRAINPLGVPIDGGPALTMTRRDKYLVPIQSRALGIEFRDLIKEQLVTGFTLVDSLIPIGRGQRELIITDSRSGKLQFLIDLIINQKNSDVLCVYGAIGKPIAELKNVLNTLEANKALKHTVVVAGTASDSPPLTFLTPMSALSIAEYFARQGRDVLLILDDLVTHAKIYREISLMSERFPARESYPADIFNIHAKLLERAGRFNKKAGGKSITAIPVAEISSNDFASYIPTNLMSMTDGHLMFKASLYNKNQRPAIDIGLSVSRVGKQTQTPIQNRIGTLITQVLAKAAESSNITSFEFELPQETRTILHQKALIEEILVQQSLTFLPRSIQLLLLCLPFTPYMLEKEPNFFSQNRQKIIDLLIKTNIIEIKSEEDVAKRLDVLLRKSL